MIVSLNKYISCNNYYHLETKMSESIEYIVLSNGLSLDYWGLSNSE